MPTLRQRHPSRRSVRKTRRARLPWIFPKRTGDETSWHEMGLALALTVFLHGLFWQAVPHNFAAALVFPAPAPEVRQVAVAPDMRQPIPEELLPEEWRSPPPRFVHVNPEAPTLEPPDTRNTGAATQRAAQPEPDSGARNDMPRVMGEEADSTRIVNHLPRELLPPQLQPEPYRPLGQPGRVELAPVSASPTAPEPPARASDGPAPAQSLPQMTPVTAKGLAVAENTGPAPVDPAAPPGKGAEAVRAPGEEKRPGAAAGTAVRQGDTGVQVAAPTPAPQQGQNAADTQVPRPRPRAARVGTTGILTRNTTGTSEAGVLAVDARYSEFGDYTQRMMEIIQANWWLTIDRSRIREGYDKRVVVAFTLCSDGTIKDVEIVSSNASQAGTYACRDAIESRAPFDPWTQEMVAMLNEEERGRFTFYYR